MSFFKKYTAHMLLVAIATGAVVFGIAQRYRNLSPNVLAANLNFTEDFTTTTNRDATATTGEWGATSGQANLADSAWTNLTGTSTTHDTIGSTTSLASTSSYAIGTNDEIYVIWSDKVATESHIFFSRWNGTTWVKMDGTAGNEDISQSDIGAGSYRIYLDGNNNPYVVWVVGISAPYLTHWTGSAWAQMDGTTSPSYENLQTTAGVLPNTFEFNDVQFGPAPNYYPYFTAGYWNAGYTIKYLVFSKWNGTAWEGMGGAASPQTLVTGKGFLGVSQLALDNTGNPYLLFRGGSGGIATTFIGFTKWSAGAGAGVCGGPTDCWTNMLGDTSGYETFSISGNGTPYPKLALDSNQRPHIVYGYPLYYSRWNGTAWSKADGTVGADTIYGSGSPAYAQLKLDASNQAHIVYNLTNTYYTEWNGSAWTQADGTTAGLSELIASNVGAHSLQLDSSANPYLAYYDSANSSLKMVRWNGTAWSGVDSDQSVDTIATNTASWIQCGNQAWSNECQFFLDTSDVPLFVYTSYDGGTGSSTFYATKGNMYYSTSSVVQSAVVDSTTDTITAATLTATQTLNGQTVTYYMNNTNTSDTCGTGAWQAAMSGQALTFTSAGSDLKWCATMSTTNIAVTPVISNIAISYTYVATGLTLYSDAGYSAGATNYNFTNNDTIYIEYVNVSEAGSGSVSATASNLTQTDSESVTLTETGGSSGIFRGTITTAASTSPTSSNGTLEGTDGDSLTVSKTVSGTGSTIDDFESYADTAAMKTASSWIDYYNVNHSTDPTVAILGSNDGINTTKFFQKSVDAVGPLNTTTTLTTAIDSVPTNMVIYVNSTAGFQDPAGRLRVDDGTNHEIFYCSGANTATFFSNCNRLGGSLQRGYAIGTTVYEYDDNPYGVSVIKTGNFDFTNADLQFDLYVDNVANLDATGNNFGWLGDQGTQVATGILFSDNTNFPYYTITGLSNGWNTITIPESSMGSPLDTSAITRIYFFVATGDGSLGGGNDMTVRIDNLKITDTAYSDTATVITQVPTEVKFTDSSYSDVTTLGAGAIYFEAGFEAGNAKTDTVDTTDITLISSTGDLETVRLTETGINTSIFRGSITAVASSSPTQNNDSFEIASGDTATAYIKDYKFANSSTSNTTSTSYGYLVGSQNQCPGQLSGSCTWKYGEQVPEAGGTLGLQQVTPLDYLVANSGALYPTEATLDGTLGYLGSTTISNTTSGYGASFLITETAANVQALGLHWHGENLSTTATNKLYVWNKTAGKYEDTGQSLATNTSTVTELKYLISSNVSDYIDSNNRVHFVVMADSGNMDVNRTDYMSLSVYTTSTTNDTATFVATASTSGSSVASRIASEEARCPSLDPITTFDAQIVSRPTKDVVEVTWDPAQTVMPDSFKVYRRFGSYPTLNKSLWTLRGTVGGTVGMFTDEDPAGPNAGQTYSYAVEAFRACGKTSDNPRVAEVALPVTIPSGQTIDPVTFNVKLKIDPLTDEEFVDEVKQLLQDAQNESAALQDNLQAQKLNGLVAQIPSDVPDTLLVPDALAVTVNPDLTTCEGAQAFVRQTQPDVSVTDPTVIEQAIRKHANALVYREFYCSIPPDLTDDEKRVYDDIFAENLFFRRELLVKEIGSKLTQFTEPTGTTNWKDINTFSTTKLDTSVGEIVDKANTQVQTQGTFKQNVIDAGLESLDLTAFESFEDLRDDESLKNVVLNVPDVENLIRGHDDTFILEIWNLDENDERYPTPARDATLNTNIYGEGGVVINNLVSAKYDITIRKPFALRKALNDVIINREVMNLDFTKGLGTDRDAYLKTGDINCDGRIDAQDLLDVTNVLTGKNVVCNSNGQTVTLEEADVNGDGDLNLADFLVPIKNWGADE